MADNFTRQNEIFRSKEISAGLHAPIMIVGAHTRSYVSGAESVSALTASKSLTVPSGATHADIYVEGSASTDYIRFWHDGSTPSSTVGMKAMDGEVIQSASPSTFKAINGSGTCVLRVEYYKYS